MKKRHINSMLILQAGLLALSVHAAEGVWRAQNKAAPNWVHSSGAVSLAVDLNGDNRADIAVHRPGTNAREFPVLLSNGDGSWQSVSAASPGWANAAGTIAIPGDYDGNGLADIAIVRPGSTWNTVPVLFATGNGNWRVTNLSVPEWVHSSGVKPISGDFDGNGRDDIALHRPGSSWKTVPVLFSNGNGGWRVTNLGTPKWANASNVRAIPGNFDGNNRTDIAFHRPGSGWTTVPVLFSNDDGSWRATNLSAPTWAHASGTIALAGRFDGNRRTDIAFHRPGSSWRTMPILFSQGDGSWQSANNGVTSWFHASGTVPFAGDFNGDGLTDVGLHRPGSGWSTVPVAFSKGNGSWRITNNAAPTWSNSSDTKPIVGDFDRSGWADIVFYRPGSSWRTLPMLLADAPATFVAAESVSPDSVTKPIRGISATRAAEYQRITKQRQISELDQRDQRLRTRAEQIVTQLEPEAGQVHAAVQQAPDYPVLDRSVNDLLSNIGSVTDPGELTLFQNAVRRAYNEHIQVYDLALGLPLGDSADYLEVLSSATNNPVTRQSTSTGQILYIYEKDIRQLPSVNPDDIDTRTTLRIEPPYEITHMESRRSGFDLVGAALTSGYALPSGWMHMYPYIACPPYGACVAGTGGYAYLGDHFRVPAGYSRLKVTAAVRMPYLSTATDPETNMWGCFKLDGQYSEWVGLGVTGPVSSGHQHTLREGEVAKLIPGCQLSVQTVDPVLGGPYGIQLETSIPDTGGEYQVYVSSQISYLFSSIAGGGWRPSSTQIAVDWIDVEILP
jgi:hypothetical protein